MHHDATGFDPSSEPFSEPQGAFDEPERTYPVDPHAPIALDISCETADVVIRAVARLDVLVRARGAGDRPGTADSPPGLHVLADGNRIAVSTHHGHDQRAADWGGGAGDHRGRRRGLGGWLSFGRLAPEFVTDVEIEVPVGSSLRLTTFAGAGDVRLHGLGGELTVRSGAGDLHASGCAGQIQADCGAGDVRLAECSGAVRVQTGSGDVAVDRGSLDSARFRSGSGDLALRGVGLGAGPFEVQTGSGDVLLDVYRSDRSDEPIGLRYVALSGDAHVGAGFARLRGRAAEGASPLVSVHTASGDLVARRVAAPAENSQAHASEGAVDWDAGTRIPVAPRTPAHPSANPSEAALPRADTDTGGVEDPAFQRMVGDMSLAAEPRQPAAQPDPKIAVLEAVARGELDIDEALRRLG